MRSCQSDFFFLLIAFCCRILNAAEPQLPDPMHGKVTQLLCELTAYDIMHLLHSINQNRPRTTFQG